MREPPQRRRRASDPTIGPGSHGSDAGMMTRARRRRLLAESSEPLDTRPQQSAPVGEPEPDRRKAEATVQGPEEWRDWANLLTDLVDNISGRLLSFDVAENLRFRAVCKTWRVLTADPRARLLDASFRPRNWALLSIAPASVSGPGPRRRLLNLSTAASLGVDLPALPTHCHIGAADGLLVLFHRPTGTIRLLDPLSNAVTELPPIVAAAGPSRSGSGVEYARDVNGAGFDDSTSPPTLVLCLSPSTHMASIVFAKPGDAHWTQVSPGQAASYPMYEYDGLGNILFYTLLSLGGRCYDNSPEGSVYLVELRPLPRLVEVVDQRRFALPGIINQKHLISFLVGSAGGGMLMVRYWRGVERFGGLGACDRKELFILGGVTSRIEVLEVDVAGRRLVPERSLGRCAVFLGLTHCLHISTETFPSITADSIYLGFLHQQSRGFSVYHINKKKNHRRTQSKHKFVYHQDRGFAAAARPCNLDQYLASYVDRRHSYHSACINHATHYLCQRA